MSNQPPVRPWFRLAALRPLPTPAPAPAPAPETRSSLALPTFRTTSVPSSPQTLPTQPSEPTPPPVKPAPAPAPEPTASPPRPATAVTAAQFVGVADRASAPSSPAQVSASSASLPASPIHKATVTNSSSVSSPAHKAAQPPSTSSPAKNTISARAATPTQSPKTIKPAFQSPMQSPKLKPTAPPPSPLALPPSQLKTNSEIEPKIPLEAEPKTVLVQKTIEKPKQRLNGNGELQRESGETRKASNSHHGKHFVSKEMETKEKGIHRKHSDSEDSGMRVITIAGENRGAYMEVIRSANKHELGDKQNYLHKNGNSKLKIDGYESEKSSSEEGNVNKKKDKSPKGRTPSSFPMSAFMNSNVQCVNNSLLYNTSCTHHDPGVRLSLSKKPFSEGFHMKEHHN